MSQKTTTINVKYSIPTMTDMTTEMLNIINIGVYMYTFRNELGVYFDSMSRRLGLVLAFGGHVNINTDQKMD